MPEEPQKRGAFVAGRPVMATPRLPVIALGLSLGLFLTITYLLCVLFDLMFPDQAMYPVWGPLLPGFTWLTWQSFLIGLIESFAYGWYVALIFAPLFNFFAHALATASVRPRRRRAANE